jgi:hypothetical protein
MAWQWRKSCSPTAQRPSILKDRWDVAISRHLFATLSYIHSLETKAVLGLYP